VRVYGLSNDLSAELRWGKKKGGMGGLETRCKRETSFVSTVSFDPYPKQQVRYLIDLEHQGMK